MPDDNTQGGGTPPATGSQSGETPTGQSDNQTAGSKPATWDEALAGLPEGVKALYEAHTTGLRNTVTAVRGERDALSTKLTELTKALGKDTPEAARQLVAEMATELEASNRRVTFAEEAGRPEIGCSNPKAAYLVAQADNLFDRRGNPDWAAIKAAAPELFRRTAPAGNAGQGTGTTPPATTDMNALIRRAAGR